MPYLEDAPSMGMMGVRVAKWVFELEPENAAAYVLLSSN
jgi:hypothetical protein